MHQHRGFAFPFFRQVLREGGNEGGRERTLGEEVSHQIRDPEGQDEGIHERAGAEERGHHYFPQQPGDAAERHGSGDNARGADDAGVFLPGGVGVWRRGPVFFGEYAGSAGGRLCQEDSPYLSRKRATVWMPL